MCWIVFKATLCLTKMIEHLVSNGLINLRTAGAGGVWTPPPPVRFFANSKKTAALRAAGFSPTLSPIFLATVLKVSVLGHARSGHQVRSGDHTLQKLYNHYTATVFEERLWNFWICYGHQYIKNVYLGFFMFVTLGQVIFATSPL